MVPSRVHEADHRLIPSSRQAVQSSDPHCIFCSPPLGFAVGDLVGEHAEGLALEDLHAQLLKKARLPRHGCPVDVTLSVHEHELVHHVRALEGDVDGDGASERGADEGDGTSDVLLNEADDVVELGRGRERGHDLHFPLREPPAKHVHCIRLDAQLFELGQQPTPLEAGGVETMQEEERRLLLAALHVGLGVARQNRALGEGRVHAHRHSLKAPRHVATVLVLHFIYLPRKELRE
mmetsp:Transcript_14948/g.34411  ORF Transcript_14948/g.34411 Transcript_14948/m.34411 type:complete len:235 (-) Transcript_14948:163-867(-)